MRIPVFARGSNPAVDRRLQRKNLTYGIEEVAAGRADWVDPDDHSKGIICRAILYSGERLAPPLTPVELARLVKQMERLRRPTSGEIPGIIVRGIPREHNPTMPQVLVASLATAAPTWDWTQEPANA